MKAFAQADLARADRRATCGLVHPADRGRRYAKGADLGQNYHGEKDWMRLSMREPAV